MDEAQKTLARVRQVREAYRRIVEGREVRKRAGLTLDDMAELIGADAAQVSRWERGRTTPTRRNVLRYAAALDEVERSLSLGA